MSLGVMSRPESQYTNRPLASFGLGEQKENEEVSLVDDSYGKAKFAGIVGQSAALRQVLKRVEMVAESNATVLLLGETGTGKELVARAIHERSQRRKESFVTLNCGAIPSALFESELFGHERGAFTGAHMLKIGRLEMADRGTMFLDEVGEMPLELQPKLLRALQERAFERVGSARTRNVDMRLVAATNCDLEQMMEDKQFRCDLYYRLNVFPIRIPPLRERLEDIPMLVQYFIDHYARELGKNIRSVSKETLALFQSYAWPGNIRELRNVIERSIIVCDTESFSVDDSWLSSQPLPAQPTGKLELRQRVANREREAIEAALTESRGRVFGPEGAALRLGIARSTLEAKIRTLKIDKNRFKISNPSLTFS